MKKIIKKRKLQQEAEIIGCLEISNLSCPLPTSKRKTNEKRKMEICKWCVCRAESELQRSAKKEEIKECQMICLIVYVSMHTHLYPHNNNHHFCVHVWVPHVHVHLFLFTEIDWLVVSLASFQLLWYFSPPLIFVSLLTVTSVLWSHALSLSLSL